MNHVSSAPIAPRGPAGVPNQVVAILVGRFTGQGVTGTYVNTVADGSTFSGSYSGSFAPIPGSPNIGFQTVLVIESGTSRLAGLRGQATSSPSSTG